MTIAGESRGSVDCQDSVSALSAENKSLKRRLARERRVRTAAEEIAEQGLRDLYQKNREMEFLAEITSMANEGESVEAVLPAALTYICEFSPWTAAHAYVASERGPARNIWYAEESVDLSVLKSATAEDVFEDPQGLLAEVWATGDPLWCEDIGEFRGECPRAALMNDCGIKTAFHLPLMIASEQVAVLEFFGEFPTPDDPALTSLIQQAGIQLSLVIERDRANDRLHDALHDPLTGLPNRRYFLRSADEAFRRSAQDRDAGFCVLFVDLDRFKMVNDSLGHAAGDSLIKQVAVRLKTGFQDGGIVDPSAQSETQAVVSRNIGGDEFMILVREVCRHEDATAIAEQIQHVLAEPFDIEGHEVGTTASIGIALSSSEPISAEELVRHADLAMCQAKERGKARSVLYDSEMQDSAVRRLELHSELQAAVRDEAFELHYQPVVSLADGEVAGVEALIRWRFSPTELRYPGRFIAVAEETGLIVPIGMWVLREACRAAVRWNDARGPERPLTVSLNLSPRQFAEPDLVEQISAILSETGVRPELLRLEVTETMTMDDADYAANVLDQLRGLGLQLSLDDFGTGFSSLSYLHRYPMQILKVDRSFVSKMETNEESLQIVKTIVVLARSLGMAIVAEGAERPEEVVRLRALGCEYCQGYYFSPPLPADELEVYLEQPPHLPSEPVVDEDSVTRRPGDDDAVRHPAELAG